LISTDVNDETFIAEYCGMKLTKAIIFWREYV